MTMPVPGSKAPACRGISFRQVRGHAGLDRVGYSRRVVCAVVGGWGGHGFDSGRVVRVKRRVAALLGMSAYFAGVVQAPMTAFVIILEMTGNHDNVVPVMAASMIGYGTARLIAPEPLYHALSRLWAADVLRKVRASSTVEPAEPAPPPQV